MPTPFQTSKADWDTFFDQFYVYFTQKMKAKATKVDAIETYAPTDYAEFEQAVKSLPARYDYEGTRKTVLVPIEILGRDAKQAAEEARTATTEAQTATKEANDARDNANRAASEADKAREDFEKVRDETLAARDAANEAANNANLTASELNKTNEAIREEEAQRQTAETLREQAFREALSRFDSSLTELQGFTELAKKAWDEFVALYTAKQAEIEEAEAKRVQAETKRQSDTSQALSDMREATDRFNALCDNPPILQGDPLTWWIWDEESGEYKDTGNTAQYPELYPITADVWNEIMNETDEEENSDTSADKSDD